MKKVLVFAAFGEAATGLALLLVPSLVGRLLLGEDLAGIAIPVARVAGIALVALGIACWPGPARIGMLVYSAAVTLYLAYLGLRRRRGRSTAVAGSRPACDPDGTFDTRPGGRRSEAVVGGRPWTSVAAMNYEIARAQE